MSFKEDVELVFISGTFAIVPREIRLLVDIVDGVSDDTMFEVFYIARIL